MGSSGWYFARGGNKVGPYDLPQLRQLVAAGQLTASDMVWREGLVQWMRASAVYGLFPDLPISGEAATATSHTGSASATEKAQSGNQLSRTPLLGRVAARVSHTFLLGVGCGAILGAVIGAAVAWSLVGRQAGRPSDTQQFNVDQGGGQADRVDRKKGEAGVTRSDFRKTVMSFKSIPGGKSWDGMNRTNGQWLFHRSADFHKAFGEPAKSQLIDKQMMWYWQCTDGEVQVVLDHEQASMMRSYKGGTIYAYEEPGATRLQPGEIVALAAINEY